MIAKENIMPTNKNFTPDETAGFHVEGHIRMFDPDTFEVYHDKRNAIHFENMSVALATGLTTGTAIISGMSFGNGGTVVDPTGLITYLQPNTVGESASLYSETYFQAVTSLGVQHATGTTFSDIVVTCLLDYNDGPANQPAIDNSPGTDAFVFDELGIRGPGSANGKLLTHIVFHPVQKSLNRRIQIDYTIRIQSVSPAMVGN